jgi:hypothetical protein
VTTPSLKQFAGAAGKVCRYAGRAAFYSVLLHLFVCADLVEPKYRLWALTHDLGEYYTGDLNSNWKSSEFRHAEDRLLDGIHRDLKIPRMNRKAHRVVKHADVRSRFGEIWTVGDPALRKTHPVRDREAEKLTLHYARMYPPSDTISNGRAVREWVRRFKIYKKLAK